MRRTTIYLFSLMIRLRSRVFSLLEEKYLIIRVIFVNFMEKVVAFMEHATFGSLVLSSLYPV
jgi:hypothetical protein